MEAGIAAAANPISTCGLVGGVEQVARAKAAVQRVSSTIRDVFLGFQFSSAMVTLLRLAQSSSFYSPPGT